MNAMRDYQVVVTYRDDNGVWKVRTVDEHDLKASHAGRGEEDLDCLVPTFWESVPRSTRIEHVAVHADFGVGGVVHGRTFHLPWPPPSPDETPRPALAMHIRLRYAADDTPTSAAWNPATT